MHICSYNLPFLFQIKPLVGPTKAIMEVHISTFQWHEFFPRGTEHKDVNVVDLFDLFVHHSNHLLTLCSKKQYWCCNCTLGSDYSCRFYHLTS